MQPLTIFRADGYATTRRSNLTVRVKVPFRNDSIVAPEDISKPLIAIKGCWPFDFAEDELIVEERRLIIKRNFFPFGTTISTFQISELSVFEVTHSLFFSSIEIIAGGAGGMANLYQTTIKWLRRKDAQKVRDIVDGLRMNEKQQDITILPNSPSSMARTARILGKA